jgi:distribution and morphology protein 10
VDTEREQWAAGMEVYYTAAEKSGGVSMGMRYRMKDCLQTHPTPVIITTAPTKSRRGKLTQTRTVDAHTSVPTPVVTPNFTDLTFTVNPILGHLTSTYTTSLSHRLRASTRYHFNTYSFDSDLAFGFAFISKDGTQALKARLSKEEVIWDICCCRVYLPMFRVLGWCMKLILRGFNSV